MSFTPTTSGSVEGSNLWSCARNNVNNAWNFNGNNGFWDNNNMYNGYRVRPLSNDGKFRKRR